MAKAKLANGGGSTERKRGKSKPTTPSKAYKRTAAEKAAIQIFNEKRRNAPNVFTMSDGDLKSLNVDHPDQATGFSILCGQIGSGNPHISAELLQQHLAASTTKS